MIGTVIRRASTTVTTGGGGVRAAPNFGEHPGIAADARAATRAIHPRPLDPLRHRPAIILPPKRVEGPNRPATVPPRRPLNAPGPIVAARERDRRPPSVQGTRRRPPDRCRILRDRAIARELPGPGDIEDRLATPPLRIR